MILSNKDITRRIQCENIVFEPHLDKFQLQQHSVDLRLGFKFLIPKVWGITDQGRVALNIDHLNSSASYDRATIINIMEGQFFEILPGEHITVSTLEKIKLPNDLMAVLFPRSSVNRRGLSVDLTGIVDAGYEGNLLIPVRNNTQSQIIRLYPGERFCQIVFEEITGDAGLRQSRWQNNNIEVTIRHEEDNEEIEYVRTGRITKMKELFGI